MSATDVRYEPTASRDWILAVAAGRVLAVSSALSVERRAAAWVALEERSPLTEILDRVVGGSLTDAPDFTLVGWEDGPEGGLVVHVFSRGSLSVALTTAAGVEKINSDGVATWAERRIVGVQGIAVGATVSADAGLPLVHGMVFGSGLTVGASRAAASATPPKSEPAAQATSAARRGERGSEETIAAPVEATPRPSDEQEAAVAPSAPASTSSDGTGGSYDHLFGVTVARPIAAAAVRPPSQEEDVAVSELPGDSPASEDDAGEHTVMTKDIDALRAKRRKARAATVPEPAVLTHFLEASDGHRETIDGTLLLGRAPVVTRVSGGAVPRLIKVTTPNQELSRTHVEVKIEGGVVVVTDLHSKNGTLVTPPGKAAQQLRAGEPTTVIPGSTIDLGDTAVYTVGEE